MVDANSSITNNLRLPGQYYDEETGLHYNFNRYFDPETGKYTQTDPAGSFADANLYRYAYNNPALVIDPYGDYGFVGAGIGAVIGGVSGYLATGTWQGALGGAAIGGAAGFIGQFGVSLRAGIIIGALVGAGSELAWQMVVEGKSFKCVDKGQVAKAGLLGGVTGGLGKWIEKGLAARQAAKEASKWTSKDPLVGDLANKIESLYPGHVKGVNVPLYDDVGKLVTDADILLDNAVLQVKSGGGKGLSGQLIRTQQVTDLPVIGYGPSLKSSVIKGIERIGGLVTTSESLLLEVIRP